MVGGKELRRFESLREIEFIPIEESCCLDLISSQPQIAAFVSN
jgi:hypothetical protein